MRLENFISSKFLGNTAIGLGLHIEYHSIMIPAAILGYCPADFRGRAFSSGIISLCMFTFKMAGIFLNQQCCLI